MLALHIIQNTKVSAPLVSVDLLINYCHCNIILLEHAVSWYAHADNTTKRKQNQLSNGDRKWICKRKLLCPRETHSLLAEAFKSQRNPDITLRPSTISTIVKCSTKWLAIPDGKDNDKRSRPCQEPMLEATLLAWHRTRVEAGETINDEQLKVQAKGIANSMGINTDRLSGGLSFSSGWLCNFKKRNGLVHYNRNLSSQLLPVQERWLHSEACHVFCQVAVETPSSNVHLRNLEIYWQKKIILWWIKTLRISWICSLRDLFQVPRNQWRLPLA